MKFRFLSRYRDEGLLLLRVGIGVMFLFHGGPKLLGGPDKWQQVGSALGYLGIEVYPTFWGLLAGLSEFGGGLCLIFGWLFRPACLLMALTMLVATSMHLGRGDGLMGASHAIESGILFVSLILVGPGRFSFDK